jgi:hypothetical protein
MCAAMPASASRSANQLHPYVASKTASIGSGSSSPNIEGLAPQPVDDSDAFEARVSALIADHVEPARVKVLDEMGEGRRAASVAMAWLVPRLG